MSSSKPKTTSETAPISVTTSISVGTAQAYDDLQEHPLTGYPSLTTALISLSVAS